MIRVEEGRKKSKTSYLHTDFLKENFQDFSLFFSLFGVNFFRIYFIKKKIRKLFFVLLRGKKKLNLKKLGEKTFFLKFSITQSSSPVYIKNEYYDILYRYQ